jgi:hypothetical protein
MLPEFWLPQRKMMPKTGQAPGTVSEPAGKPAGSSVVCSVTLVTALEANHPFGGDAAEAADLLMLITGYPKYF